MENINHFTVNQDLYRNEELDVSPTQGASYLERKPIPLIQGRFAVKEECNTPENCHSTANISPLT